MSRDDTNAIAFYKQLPPFTDTLRIFERGSDPYDYTAFGPEARRVAAIAHRYESAARRASDKETSSTTVNRNLLATLLRGALEQGLKIEIYTQDGRKFAKTRQASPGSILEIEDLLGEDNVETPLVAAVRIQKAAVVKVGVAFGDSLNKTLGLAEFEDNEVLGNLEAFIIQLGIRELLVEDSQTSALAARANISVTHIDKKDYTKGAEEVIRLSGLSEKELGAELGRPLACSCAAALAKNLDLKSVKIVKHDLSQYMRLDSAALKALNILPSARDQSKSQSLFGLLNKCQTVAGSRLLSQWLKQPLLNIEAIKQRHDKVEALINGASARSALAATFGVVPDMTKIIRKFHKRQAKLDDVVRIYQLAIRLPEFVEQLAGLPQLQDISEAVASSSHELAKLVELVETTVDLRGERDFKIRADFDERLIDLQSQREQIEQSLKELHQEHGDRLGMEPEKKLKLDNSQNWGWCFRLTRNEATVLRSHKGYIELATQKAGIYFTTTELKQLNTEFAEIETKYTQTQSKIVQEIVNITSTYLVVLTPLGETLSNLDVLCAFAEASSFAAIPYTRPKMNNGGSTVLRAARHPCMEAQDTIQFIPNDVELDRTSSEFLIITGPNMGGKSTFIRQIGVIALMAQVGCFVPCDAAEISVFDCILARVGAGDSQLKGISTFMAEMLETASILKTATKHSLIVIDELGRGTSTYDGFGLAWAISQHIIEQIGCYSVFATHFHELTALADVYPQAENLHVVADTTSGTSDITLLYKVAKGISDKSFGIHVAEVVNFPEKIVRMAKRKAQELEDLDSESFSQSEVNGGNELLQGILGRWAAEAPSEPQEAVKKLRQLMESERKEMEKQPFLRSLLTSL